MIENINNWYQGVRKKVAYFMLALLVSYVFLFLNILAPISNELLLISMSLTLIIPFSMFVMLASDNPIYELTQSKQWSKVTLRVILTIYGSLSFIWASSEVNAIFAVAPSNLPWSTMLLTIIYFFKTIIYFGALGALICTFLYANIWYEKILTIKYKGVRKLIVDIFSGVVFVLGIGLLLGSSNMIVMKRDVFVKRIALAADFSTHHNCNGSEFINSQGVLFLSTDNVLVAKPTLTPRGWDLEFPEVKCNK